MTIRPLPCQLGNSYQTLRRFIERIFQFYRQKANNKDFHFCVSNKVVDQTQTLLESVSVSGLRAQTKFSILILKKAVKGTATQLLTPPQSANHQHCKQRCTYTPGKIRLKVVIFRVCDGCIKAEDQWILSLLPRSIKWKPTHMTNLTILFDMFLHKIGNIISSKVSCHVIFSFPSPHTAASRTDLESGPGWSRTIIILTRMDRPNKSLSPTSHKAQATKGQVRIFPV